MNLLLGCTGSVASIKLAELVKLIKEKIKDVNIKIVMTQHAEFFLTKEDLDYLRSATEMFKDEDEWKDWKKIGDSIIHIDNVKWADMMLIAPLDANTMAKLANGICDNLTTCICRAWDFSKPLLYAPAMNTHMWNHPVTKKHTDILESWKYIMVPPIDKHLACGDTGIGAMEEVPKVVDAIVEHMKK